ncbi:hypothetical protein R5M54_001444 [Vibrio alginolyticus]|nr:hypothetical protein [Vibrio alginolyticus]
MLAAVTTFNKRVHSIMNMNLPKPPMGNQRARKHSDLQIAEVIALREKYSIGFGQISYLTGIPKGTVRSYCVGERACSLLSSKEFNQRVDEIKRMLSAHPPASRKGVLETKAEMRKRLRAERQRRLEDESIMHTPVPTVQQVAKAKAQVQAQIVRQESKPDELRRRAIEKWNRRVPVSIEKAIQRGDYERVEMWLR